jgi:hypothetical protein
MFLLLFLAGFVSVLSPAQSHTLHRRSLGDVSMADHSHSETNDVTNKKSGPLMEQGSIGYTLIQHNNPDLPGEKRHMQALDSPFFTGICNPDMVTLFFRHF